MPRQKYTRGLLVGWTPKIHWYISSTTPLNFIGVQKVRNLVSHRRWSHPLTKLAGDGLQLHSAHNNMVISPVHTTHVHGPCSWAVFMGHEHRPWAWAVWTGGRIHGTRV